MPPLRRFAARLRKLREKRGMTQEQLAQRARVSRVYVTLIETKRADPRLSIAVKLAKALRVSISELID